MSSIKLVISRRKRAGIVLLVVGVFISLVAVTYLTTTIFQDGMRYISHAFNSNNTGQLVTYYQWVTPNGKTRISRTPPTMTDQYISFQASQNLMENQNRTDDELILKGELARAEIMGKQENNDNWLPEQSDDLANQSGDYAVLMQQLTTILAQQNLAQDNQDFESLTLADTCQTLAKLMDDLETRRKILRTTDTIESEEKELGELRKRAFKFCR